MLLPLLLLMPLESGFACASPAAQAGIIIAQDEGHESARWSMGAPPAAPVPGGSKPPSGAGSGQSQQASDLPQRLDASFLELRTHLQALYSEFPSAVTLNIEEEVLHKAWDGARNDPNWQCYPLYDKEVCPGSQKAKKALKSHIDAMNDAWKRAQALAKQLPGAQLPRTDAKGAGEVTACLGKLLSAFKKLDSSGTAQPRALQSFWKGVQEFADAVPGCLPRASAESMVPSSVTVRCVGVRLVVH